MDRTKNLIDNNERGFILNESGTSVRTDSIEQEKEKRSNSEHQENVKAEEGSKSDPQLTELDGLKKGGVPPHVNPEDEEQIREDPSSDR